MSVGTLATCVGTRLSALSAYREQRRLACDGCLESVVTVVIFE